MKTAKEWHYSKYVVGIDDERNGTYEWFKEMEDYAKFYHEAKVKNISSNGVLSDFLMPSELIALKNFYDAKRAPNIAQISKNEEQIEADKISANIEKQLQKIANNFH